MNGRMDGWMDEMPPTQTQAVPGTLVVCTVTAFLTWTALLVLSGSPSPSLPDS